MKRVLFLLACFISLALSTAAVAFSQSSMLSAQNPLSTKKNTLSLSLSMRSYFDGSPFWQQPYPGPFLSWMNLGFGMQYSRMLDGRHGIGCSALASTMQYFGSNLKKGDTFERALLSIDAFYQYQVLVKEKIELFLTVGPNFRYGFESVLVARLGREPFVENYDYRDFGLSIGIRASRIYLRHLVISPEIRSTTYLYRYGRHHIRFNDLFPNRPTIQMLTYQLGVGIRF